MRLTGGIGADLDDASAVAPFDDYRLGDMRAFLALRRELSVAIPGSLRCNLDVLPASEDAVRVSSPRRGDLNELGITFDRHGHVGRDFCR